MRVDGNDGNINIGKLIILLGLSSDTCTSHLTAKTFINLIWKSTGYGW